MSDVLLQVLIGEKRGAKMLRNRDEGFALVGVLLVTVSLLTVVSGILVYGATTNKRAVDEQSQARAFYAAESGISHAIAKFKVLLEAGNLPDWPNTEEEAYARGPFAQSTGGEEPKYKAWIYRETGNYLRIIAQGEDKAIIRNVSITISNPAAGGNGVGRWPTCNYPSTKVSWTGNGNADHSKVTYSTVEIQNHKTETITVANEFYAENLSFKPNGILKLVGKGPVTVCIKNLNLNGNAQPYNLIFDIDGDIELISEKVSAISNSNVHIGAKTVLTMWADTVNLNKTVITDLATEIKVPTTWPRLISRSIDLGQHTTFGSDSSRPMIVYLVGTNALSGKNQSVIYGKVWTASGSVSSGSATIQVPSSIKKDFDELYKQVPFPGIHSGNVKIEDYTNRL